MFHEISTTQYRFWYLTKNRMRLFVFGLLTPLLFLVSVNQSHALLLVGDPPTVNFRTNPSPASVMPNEPVILEWDVSQAKLCQLYNGHMNVNNGTGQSIAVDESGNKLVAPIWKVILPNDGEISDQLTVYPQETGEYTLICASSFGYGPPRNEKGFAVRRVLITVSLPPIPPPSNQNPVPPSQNPGTTNPNPGQASVSSGALLNFANPLAFTTVPSLLTTLLTSLQNIIVTLALIFIIIGAFLYLTSGGNESRMEAGKKAILAAVIGLAIGIAAPAFLKEIAAILGWANYAPLPGVGTSLSFSQILFNILSFLLTIIGIITIIMLVIGGIMYLTAAGNEDQIDKGKKIVKYSLIGITIALAALVLVKQVAKFFVG